MRPFITDPERLRGYVAKKGKPVGKALLLLKMCEEHLEAISVLAGDPKVKEQNVLSQDGRKKAMTDDGKPIMETVPVLDQAGQPVFEDGELSATELILYQITSTLVSIVRDDRTFGDPDGI